jgi:hypothetical protein
MNSTKIFVSLSLILMLLFGATGLFAQETTPPIRTSARLNEKPGDFYRLDLVMRETENGKTTSTRSYTLFMRANDTNQGYVRAGNDIPMANPTPTTRDYRGSGVDLSCMLSDIDSDSVQLRLQGSVSSVVPSEKGLENRPVFRTMSFSAGTPLIPGKTTMVSSIDDPSNNRRLQIDATATKLK